MSNSPVRTPRVPGALVVAAFCLAAALASACLARAADPAASAPKTPRPLDGPIAEYQFKPSTADDEALIFTPEGFDRPGVPAEASGPDVGRLRLVVSDAKTGQPTPCRVNVVGADGNYYQPKDHPLKAYSLTGVWPKTGKGNRPEKAPIRYFGRFFYATGPATVEVPPGPFRVEVWKGLEFRPETRTFEIGKQETRTVAISLERAVPMSALGYESGDPHIHIARTVDDDDRVIFDLMKAEDIRRATLLAYNEPAGPYSGTMDSQATPQNRGLGRRSIRTDAETQILSGQEYRNGTYGHMNLFLLDDLVLRGESVNANNWPLYGDIARKARESGGVAWYAHGGYAQEIYADVAQGNIDAVELLQFGVYRGIGLTDWYRMLNCGFPIPAVGACDYPACRKLGDCVTYVLGEPGAGIESWLRGAAAGRSFVTTGPLLLLEVDGQAPGSRIAKSGLGPHRVTCRVRVRSEVAPVSNVQLIVNGRVLVEKEVPAGQRVGRWIDFEQTVELDRSAWIAARADSLSRLATPDAEAHTNPVHVLVGDKAPYERAALDDLVARIDAQLAAHKARTFAEKARVLAYFEKSRDILLKIREAGGAPAQGHPSEIARDASLLDDPGRRAHTEAELRAYLKPIPPRPIDEVLRTFDTRDGFRMELVAREPIVASPVAAAFDEDGNLYVAEMRDYPYKPRAGKEPIGSLRLLIDTDGDGRFDEGHLFADHLLWAAGIAPWKGGVFVAAPPDIWYLKDTDGDHKADVRQKVFSGFGTQNQQAMLNNLQWGIDHKIYGATAGNGGTVRPSTAPTAPAVVVDGRDFRFDPVSLAFEPVTGTVQFGNTFDDWGERFLCSESQPLLHAVLPQRELARNPDLAVPLAIENLAPGPVPIFRISPIERWRQIRSSRRIAHNARPATAAGASHHVVDAAAGVTVYRGGAYPAHLYGNVFVGDAQNNLVHRRVLEPKGVTFTSRRGDAGTEFVRSPDNWFRPVNFVNAPDGTLYVLDMCREILESIHIPSDVVKHLDLTSGRDRGRIYRLAPPGFHEPPPPRLSRATSLALVEALESPHGWWRDTAHRLLFERQDRTVRGPLRRLLESSGRPQSRVLALWSLEGLGVLSEEDLIRGLSDVSIPVQTHALQLSGSRLASWPRLLDRILALRADDPRLQFRLAFTLGETKDRRAIAALSRILRGSAGDPWIRAAVLSSSSEFAEALLSALVRDRAFVGRPEGPPWIASLATVVGSRKRPAEIARALETLAWPDAPEADHDFRLGVVLAIGEALGRVGGRLDALVAEPGSARTFLEREEREARRRLGDASSTTAEKQTAIRLLACLSFARTREALKALLDVRQPEPVQVEALRALAGYPDPEVAPIVLARWREVTPMVREQSLETLLGREDRTLAFLKAVEDGRADAAPLGSSRRARLLEHPTVPIRSLARKVLGASKTGTRAQVVAEYAGALRLSGVPDRGSSVFRRECAACHKLGDVGTSVGPDLTSAMDREREALLVHILDPNREVLPNFLQYQVADHEGRVYSGLIAAQSATSLTLLREGGKVDTVLRSQIEEIVGSGRSLMPEGFETRISKPEMADLIAFLQGTRPGKSASEAPLEIGTLPGLVEPDR